MTSNRRKLWLSHTSRTIAALQARGLVFEEYDQPIR
jgi:hypothetical protein